MEIHDDIDTQTANVVVTSHKEKVRSENGHALQVPDGQNHITFLATR